MSYTAYNMTKIFRTGNWQCHIPNINMTSNCHIPSESMTMECHMAMECSDVLMFWCSEYDIASFPFGILLSYYMHNVTILGISSCTKLLIPTVKNSYICNICIFLYPRAENALTVTDVSSALKKCGTPTVWDTLS